MIKCCIFDLDGTVLDTISTITHFVNRAHRENGIEPITEDECKYFVGEGAKKLITRSLLSKGIGEGELSRKVFSDYNAAYNADPLYLTKPFSGIAELLSSLKSRGIKLVLISNKPHVATESVVKHFFDGVFDFVSGALPDVPLKPDPTLARRILAELDIDPSECAWIGDTSTDMKTGKNLGVALNIGVLWGFRKIDELRESGADVIVDKVGDILREVERLA